MPRPKKNEGANLEAKSITIEPLQMKEVSLFVLGASPLIYNRQSVKAQRELLFPAVQKNRAAKRTALKHDPLLEYRNSVYRDGSPNGPTRLVFPAPAFKAAAATAALAIPGATKAEVGRLLQVVGFSTRIYGTPQLFMAGVRQAGIARTPDIRTRAILPEWATMVTVRYPKGLLDPQSIANLLAAGGQIAGIGDFRQEKGKGSFGLYSIVNEDDETFNRIVETQGREAQDAALENPEAFNEESAELFTWFEEEVTARGRDEEVEALRAANDESLTVHGANGSGATA